MTLAEAKAFITLWYESATLAEVVERSGLDRRRVDNLAAYFRRCGVELPRLIPNPTRRPKQMTEAGWHEAARWAQLQKTLREIRRLRAKQGG